jgi:hypothetical protein
VNTHKHQTNREHNNEKGKRETRSAHCGQSTTQSRATHMHAVPLAPAIPPSDVPSNTSNAISAQSSCSPCAEEPGQLSRVGGPDWTAELRSAKQTELLNRRRRARTKRKNERVCCVPLSFPLCCPPSCLRARVNAAVQPHRRGGPLSRPPRAQHSRSRRAPASTRNGHTCRQ